MKRTKRQQVKRHGCYYGVVSMVGTMLPPEAKIPILIRATHTRPGAVVILYHRMTYGRFVLTGSTCDL